MAPDLDAEGNGDDGYLGDALMQCLVADLVEFRAGQCHVFTGSDAEFAGDGRRRVWMIAGDHHHADASTVAFHDGLLRLGARRVIHAGEADKDEIVLHFLSDELF